MSQIAFSVRMDASLKEEFSAMCEAFGMPVSTAINLFAKAVVHLENGNDLVITADGTDKGPYVQDMKLNGKTWSHNYLSHDSLMKGGKIEFTLDGEPNCSRGTKEEDKPYSYSRSH